MQMMLLLLLSALIGNVFSVNYRCARDEVPCGCGHWDVFSAEERIINGVDSFPYAWSMVTSIRMFDEMQHDCGGTILTESHVLTAASCVEQVRPEAVSDVSVAAGMYFLIEKNTILRKADAIYMHPQWSKDINDLTHDIAIIHLKEPFNFTGNTYIARSCIPRRDSSIAMTEHPSADATLMSIGWGYKSQPPDGEPSLILQQTRLSAIHHNDTSCSDSIYDPERQFCAGSLNGNAGPCTGTCFRSFPSVSKLVDGDKTEQSGQNQLSNSLSYTSLLR